MIAPPLPISRCTVFLSLLLSKEYPVLTATEIDVEEVTWLRARVASTRADPNGPMDEYPHAHGILRNEPEHPHATVS